MMGSLDTILHQNRVSTRTLYRYLNLNYDEEMANIRNEMNTTYMGVDWASEKQ